MTCPENLGVAQGDGVSALIDLSHGHPDCSGTVVSGITGDKPQWELTTFVIALVLNGPGMYQDIQQAVLLSGREVAHLSVLATSDRNAKGLGVHDGMSREHCSRGHRTDVDLTVLHVGQHLRNPQIREACWSLRV